MNRSFQKMSRRGAMSNQVYCDGAKFTYELNSD